MISMINGAFVGVFGIILSAAFCDISWTKKKQWQMAGCMAGLMLLQGIAYVLFDYETVQKLYPVLTHAPLIVVLYFFTKKWLWSVISVLTAYLCCELRRWLALLTVAVCSGDAMLQNMAELILTVPLLLILLKFAAPAVRSVSNDSVSVQVQFGLIPMLSYGFSYLTQVYTGLFYSGGPVIAEFMTFVCSAAYLLFVLRTSEEKRMRSQLEHMQSTLNLQVEQAVREIELLRESQQQASIYRHDLRHHMQFLSGCIENGRLTQAQEYISKIYEDIKANKVTAFCENETINLIFSAFAMRAKRLDVEMKIKAEIPRNVFVAESDLCVLLSNALENALRACQILKEKQQAAVIEVTVYEKNGKLLLQIVNSCEEGIRFDGELPVTKEPGHGMGVRSICAVVEKYQGIYNFTVKDGNFILRVSL